MRILSTVRETFADGPGIRYSIYVSGCTNACPGCHNPESWSFDQGQEITPELVEKIRKEIEANPLITGITISGGDPMHKKNAPGLHNLLRDLSPLQKNVWVYTGYTMEEILEEGDTGQMAALHYIDTLVDGRYIEKLRDTTGFRGSSNQRILNVFNYLNAEEKAN